MQEMQSRTSKRKKYLKFVKFFFHISFLEEKAHKEEEVKENFNESSIIGELRFNLKFIMIF